MPDEIKSNIKEFILLFEEVFDKDWKYSKEKMGIQEETQEQKNNARDMGMGSIDIISENGTFLNPMVEDEIEDWGNRGALLDQYRNLKKLLIEDEKT